MVHPVILTYRQGRRRYPMELIVDLLRVEANN